MFKRKNYRFTSVLLVLVFLLVLSMSFFLERGGVRYNTSNTSYYLEKSQVKATREVQKHLKTTNLVLYDSRDKTSAAVYKNFQQMFKDMKVGSKFVNIAKSNVPDFKPYDTVVVLTTTLKPLGETALNLMDWVEKGGNAMFPLTLANDSIASIISSKIGIESPSNYYAVVDDILPSRTFMVGGGESYHIKDGFESSWQVRVKDKAKVYMTTDDSNKVPLIWSYNFGKGRVAVDNFGIYDKAYRGFYAATFSLLGEVSAYPVINGSAFTLDDFPSPVPSGDATYINRDYHMSISDFYSTVWWPDMMKLANTYGIKYTGVVIENYENQTNGRIEEQGDQSRFSYFGKTLLKLGGEIGYHGYNHQPLMLSDTDYGDAFNYKTWTSRKAVKNSLNELIRFTDHVFPNTQKSVYVPPSNILSPQARKILADDYPEIKAIASNYFDGDFVYSQEFEVAKDKMVEIPRTTSGAIIDDYTKITMLSELNMHYVSHHFIHPDDPLDADRGAKLGWKKMFNHLSNQFNWLYAAAPSIRNLTESQLAGAVERFSQVTVDEKISDKTVTLNLGNFVDEAYLMVRVNDGKVAKVSGGSLEKLSDNLYLLHATDKKVVIERD